MYLIKEGIRDNKSTDKIEVSKVVPPVILTRFKSTPKFPVPKCDYCQLYRTIKSNHSMIKPAVISEKESIIL